MTDRPTPMRNLTLTLAVASLLCWPAALVLAGVAVWLSDWRYLGIAGVLFIAGAWLGFLVKIFREQAER